VRGLIGRARTSVTIGATLSLIVLGTAVVLGGATLRVRQALAGELSSDFTSGPLPSTYPRLDRAAPPLELLGHEGAVVSLESLRGRPVLVTFAYAHCQTVCPVIVGRVIAAQERLRAREGGAPAALVVTLDPWRDTPSRLPSIADGWRLPAGDAWLLGGEPADVEAALDAWEIPRSRDMTTGEVVHPSLIYVVDRAGRIAYAASADTDVIVELVQRL
jgi:protein SCO1/2